ncbi:hypothetical protein [Myxococcus xanthus]|uniref:hypothetical protein n=1 Tax=Myxococcus xanthus TaxID=34 RepID=UPI00112BBE94|nr:hypothetical protein [Myxococcus xanthus]
MARCATPWGGRPLPLELDDDVALAALLFPEDAKVLAERPEQDWARVHAELKKKGVTQLLLWQEYLEAVPGGYQFSRFCFGSVLRTAHPHSEE